MDISNFCYYKHLLHVSFHIHIILSLGWISKTKIAGLKGIYISETHYKLPSRKLKQFVLPPTVLERAHFSSPLPGLLFIQNSVKNFMKWILFTEESIVSLTKSDDLREWMSQCYHLDSFDNEGCWIISSYVSWPFGFLPLWIIFTYSLPQSFLNPLRSSFVFFFSEFVFIYSPPVLIPPFLPIVVFLSVSHPCEYISFFQILMKFR